jgi:biotin--protein ligase
MVSGCVEEEVRIAVYNDEGVSFDSFQAVFDAAEWMGYHAVEINSESIENDYLNQYSVMVFPGGNMYKYAQDISEEGKQRMRDFVTHGGGYLGICGGGYFAAETVVWRNETLTMTPLALFAGKAEGPLDEVQPYPRCGMSNVIFGKEYTISQESKSMDIYYCWGPTFIPNEEGRVDVIGRYEATATPSAIAFVYGGGRVILVGMHPELSEPEGENWQFLRRAILWCLKEGDFVFPNLSFRNARLSLRAIPMPSL